MGKKSVWPPVVWTGTVRMQKHKQNGTHGGVYGLKKRISHDLDATSKHGKKKKQLQKQNYNYKRNYYTNL